MLNMVELKARMVIRDCETILKDLKESPETGLSWRIRWVAAMALLRTVGYVLPSIDSQLSVKHKDAIDSKMGMSFTQCLSG